MRGVTISLLNDLLLEDISTHTPHARRDQNGWLNANDIRISTHTPHARRDLLFCVLVWIEQISTHTPHARRDLAVDGIYGRLTISTHTPHARRDGGAVFYVNHGINFYSHASCEA